MASAQERNQAQQRPLLLARLKKLDTNRLVKYVEENSLPSTTSTWTFEQLKGAVETLEAPEPEVEVEAGQQFVVGHSDTQFQVRLVTGDEEATKVSEEMPENFTTYIVASPADLKGVPVPILLGIFNLAKGTKAKKFVNEEAALGSAFDSLAKVAELQAPKAPAPAAKGGAKKAATPKAPKEPKAPKLLNYEPKAKDAIKQVKKGTKIAALIDLLAKDGGTTVEEIETELSKSGKTISARAWLGYDLHTVAGYGVRQDGDRLYLVLPKGMKEPLEHKTPEPPKPPVAKKAATTKAEAPAAEEVELPVAKEPVAAAPAPAVKGGAKKGGAKKAAAATA